MKKRFRRSWLYVPAIKKDVFPRLEKCDSDAFVFDLEDGVPEALKEEARGGLPALKDLAVLNEKECFIRINSIDTPHFRKDVAMATSLGPVLDGVIFPKAQSAREIGELEALLKETSLEIVPIIETLKGEHHCLEIIAASGRISTVQWAESGDYSLDFGLFGKAFDGSRDSVANQFAIRVVKLCRMEGKQVLDGAYLKIQDDEGFKARCAWASELGFDGKAAIHPRQVEMINRIMTPGREKIEKAREMVRAYETYQGRQSFVPFEGSFITPPIYKSAKNFLEKYEKFFAN